jgi:hypothetical protein
MLIRIGTYRLLWDNIPRCGAASRKWKNDAAPAPLANKIAKIKTQFPLRLRLLEAPVPGIMLRNTDKKSILNIFPTLQNQHKTTTRKG